jgi:DNA polymerase III subunit epsilon
MRQIILDTETTGLETHKGHRIIEIGCVELIDRKLTGNHYHAYINPEREVDEGAYKVHGIGSDFLAEKPLFKEISQQFLDYIKGAELIIHNAPFDVGFINHEFKLLKDDFQPVTDYCKILDTLVMARKKHPGQKNNLDALCRRYDIDNSNRQLHGALLDAEILALVYLAMTGGQGALFDNNDNHHVKTHDLKAKKPAVNRTQDELLKIIDAKADEIEAHLRFVSMIKDKSGVNLWED